MSAKRVLGLIVSIVGLCCCDSAAEVATVMSMDGNVHIEMAAGKDLSYGPTINKTSVNG